MIRSMTAYAQLETAFEGGQLSCELRSVNSRYLEQNLRLPEELRAIESALREKLASRISRGKVDMGFRWRSGLSSGADLQVNESLIGQLAGVAHRIHNRFPGMNTDFVELLRYPGVVVEESSDHASLHAAALVLLDKTLDEFIAARSREGEKLAVVIRERLHAIEAITVQVRQWLPDIRSALRAKLDAKLADLKLPLEPGRLEQEVVLNLQKIDVDEELDRLASHVQEAHRILSLPEAVGRRLDFLMQEFNRESNTLGSKSVDKRTTQAAVELKVLIEQVREQIQNLE